MTVFVRIQAPDNESSNHTDLDYIFIDDGGMDLCSHRRFDRTGRQHDHRLIQLGRCGGERLVGSGGGSAVPGRGGWHMARRPGQNAYQPVKLHVHGTRGATLHRPRAPVGKTG